MKKYFLLVAMVFIEILFLVSCINKGINISSLSEVLVKNIETQQDESSNTQAPQNESSINQVEQININDNQISVIDNQINVVKTLDGLKVVKSYSNNDRVDVMDSVVFGKYEQDDDLANGKEDIEWIILDNSNNKMLLLSKYVLDGMMFHNENKYINWNESSTRQWLNAEFYNGAFDEEEKKCILRKENLNNAIDVYYMTYNGGDEYSYIWDASYDNVSLLSFDEVIKYMGNPSKEVSSILTNKKLAATPTKYAKNHTDINISDEETWYKGCTDWFLRTMYNNSSSDLTGEVIYIDEETIAHSTNSYYFTRGIRPMLYIDTSIISENKKQYMLNNENKSGVEERVVINSPLPSELYWEMKFYNEAINRFKFSFASYKNRYSSRTDYVPNFVTEANGSVIFDYGLRDLNNDNVKELIIYNHGNLMALYTLTNSWSTTYEHYKDMFEPKEVNIRFHQFYNENTRKETLRIADDNFIIRYIIDTYTRDLSNDSYYNSLSEERKKELYDVHNYSVYSYDGMYLKEDDYEIYEHYVYWTNEGGGLGEYYNDDGVEINITKEEALAIFEKHTGNVVLNEGQIVID